MGERRWFVSSFMGSAYDAPALAGTSCLVGTGTGAASSTTSSSSSLSSLASQSSASSSQSSASPSGFAFAAAAAAAAPDAATKPRGAHRHHPRSSSLSPARLERRDTPPSAAASSHGCSPEAVSLSSPSTSARTSPLDPVALTAPASPFLLQVLIAGGADGGVGAAAGGVLGCGGGGGGGAAAGARFEAGDYAEVGGDLETVARACRQAEAGWCEEMGRYLGQTGLVAQEASADGSVLLCFADHRQHWFASEVLGAASADGVRSAPARVPGSAAAEASRSLLRAYLNTVLPGGDHAGWQNIVYFVLIPLFMLVSGIYMAWYRYNSTI
eukprot:Rhum_TRINITY_DN14798_c28_g1::Rhum_TRINITY_DN14798_c28_g1_i1::g.111110::m.111110